MRGHYLPGFYRAQHPDWTDEQIQRKIDSMTPEDMDDAVAASFYDENKDHVRLVVADIFKNWRNRSNDGKYNALLTTHVGGGKASTPMAMMYFDEFRKVNVERRARGAQSCGDIQPEHLEQRVPIRDESGPLSSDAGL